MKKRWMGILLLTGLLCLSFQALAVKRRDAATPTPEPVAVEGYACVLTDGAALRVMPDANAYSRRSLGKGEILAFSGVVFGSDGQWYTHADYEGIDGYVLSADLQEMTEEEARAVRKTPAPTPVPAPLTGAEAAEAVVLLDAQLCLWETDTDGFLEDLGYSAKLSSFNDDTYFSPYFLFYNPTDSQLAVALRVETDDYSTDWNETYIEPHETQGFHMNKSSARGMLPLGTNSVTLYVNDVLKETEVYTITRDDGSLTAFPPVSGIDAATQMEIVYNLLLKVNDKTGEWTDMGTHAQLSELAADTRLTPGLRVENAGDAAIELSIAVSIDGKELSYDDTTMDPRKRAWFTLSMEDARAYVMKPGEHIVKWSVNGLYKTELVFTVTE